MGRNLGSRVSGPGIGHRQVGVALLATLILDLAILAPVFPTDGGDDKVAFALASLVGESVK